MLCALAAETTSTTTLRVRNLAEEDSYPDLGVYLQPDPEHRASAMGSAGPQAYAYAGGRPLVNVDPSGRRFAADNDTWSFLGPLMSHPFLGQYMTELENDPDIVVLVERIQSAQVRRKGGAFSYVSNSGPPPIDVCSKRSDSCDDPDRVTIEIDPTVTLPDIIGTGFMFDPNMEWSPSIALAHECGHVYWYSHCRRTGRQSMSSNDTSLLFENSARSRPPYRLTHFSP